MTKWCVKTLRSMSFMEIKQLDPAQSETYPTTRPQGTNLLQMSLCIRQRDTRDGLICSRGIDGRKSTVGRDVSSSIACGFMVLIPAGRRHCNCLRTFRRIQSLYRPFVFSIFSHHSAHQARTVHTCAHALHSPRTQIVSTSQNAEPKQL